MILRAATCRFYSSFLLLFSIFLLIPIAVSIGFNPGSVLDTSSELWSFLSTVLILLISGFLLRVFSKSDQDSINITVRSGFLIVTTFWILAAAIGCLPFLLEIDGMSFTDAYFEAMSGFTTTGATILPDVEILGPGLSLWRCMIQWMGGMGIIILFIAVLPTLGVSGYNLFRAEIPGGTTVERIKPRITETAKSLWKVYILLTVLECFLLWGVGMPFYDSVCHAFTTMPTGGFSIKNKGIAAYDNIFIEIIIIFFMFIAGANFSLHYYLFHGKNNYFKNTEFKVYFYVLSTFSLLVLVILMVQSPDSISFGTALRHAVFQVVSIGTTTGLATTDYNYWPPAAQLLLITLMFTGGCTASTGGAIKIFRHIVSVKAIVNQLLLAANPRMIFSVKVDDEKISNEIIMNIISFIVFYMAIFVLGSICLTMTGMDIVSSISGAATALGNVGPGLGPIGPASTFASLTPFAKWVIIILMLLGRLELFTVLALIFPLLQRTKRKRV